MGVKTDFGTARKFDAEMAPRMPYTNFPMRLSMNFLTSPSVRAPLEPRTLRYGLSMAHRTPIMTLLIPLLSRILAPFSNKKILANCIPRIPCEVGSVHRGPRRGVTRSPPCRRTAGRWSITCGRVCCVRSARRRSVRSLKIRRRCVHGFAHALLWLEPECVR